MVIYGAQNSWLVVNRLKLAKPLIWRFNCSTKPRACLSLGVKQKYHLWFTTSHGIWKFNSFGLLQTQCKIIYTYLQKHISVYPHHHPSAWKPTNCVSQYYSLSVVGTLMHGSGCTHSLPVYFPLSLRNCLIKCRTWCLHTFQLSNDSLNISAVSHVACLNALAMVFPSL